VQLISLGHLDIVTEHLLGPVDKSSRVAAISKALVIVGRSIGSAPVEAATRASKSCA
jgi:hypothetical protein